MSCSSLFQAIPRLRLEPRPPESHKGNFGHVLIVGGSRGMTGAPALAALAALRSGAGLVTVAVPASCQPVVAGFEPSYMTRALPDTGEGNLAHDAAAELLGFTQNYNAWGLGPGLGRTPEVTQVVLDLYQRIEQPMVVDADALIALASHPTALAAHPGPRILTPHPGEFRRLLGDVHASVDEMRGMAQDWAARYQVILVLKGHRSLLTDGQRVYENSTGNPGMATGGSGDVLTGVIAALLGQGVTPWESACLAGYVHGLAGDLAVAKLGQVSCLATDLIRYLPDAFLNYHNQAASP